MAAVVMLFTLLLSSVAMRRDTTQRVIKNHWHTGLVDKIMLLWYHYEN